LDIDIDISTNIGTNTNIDIGTNIDIDIGTNSKPLWRHLLIIVIHSFFLSSLIKVSMNFPNNTAFFSFTNFKKYNFSDSFQPIPNRFLSN